MINLGIESYIIAATTQAILAQRLVRLICRECIDERPLNQHESAWLSKLPYKTEGVAFKYGKGCSYCNNTGYRGRMAIFELLEFNDEMAEALRSNNTASFHELAKKSEHHQLLADDAYRLVVEGKTSITEMIRVINEGYA
ncbi:MAG: hypothetical protein Q8L78_09130 [Coxiellaceae bacterium]|nr:hypothetical protein [Coxiellaceae bacterium]